MAFYDGDTQPAFQSAHGQFLARFLTVKHNPAINQSVDANFLQSRLATHVQGIQAYILARHPAASFELLWPLDVNLPETKRLNWYVNLPPSWKQKMDRAFLRSCVRDSSLAASTATWMGFTLRGVSVQRTGVGRKRLRLLNGSVQSRMAMEREFLVASRRLP